MPSVFWTGKLTLPMRVLVNVNNLLALLLGNAFDSVSMKSRVRDGYEGKFSRHVEKYDELALSLQERSAESQLEGLELSGRTILDVGCGTGVLALNALHSGARRAVCGDISMLMMQQAKRKMPEQGSLYFCQLDGEDLPFAGDCFDAVLSGMAFGLMPDQRKALREMVRVAKPGGLVSIGAHGPEHYWEAIDACFRCVGKRHILGYRLEFWPRAEAYLRRLAQSCGLEGIHSKRTVWKTVFPSGGAMYDFFAAVSSSWWYAKFPREDAERDSARTRAYFERNGIATVTDDVIAVWGRKRR